MVGDIKVIGPLKVNGIEPDQTGNIVIPIAGFEGGALPEGTSIVLGRDPEIALEAATKQYVDNSSAFANGGILSTGNTFTLGRDPIENLDAATKQYVTNAITTAVNNALTTLAENGAGLAPIEIKNENFTAVSTKRYAVNTTNSVVSALLPATPVVGDEIIFMDAAGTWGINNLILDRNGNKIESLAENINIDIKDTKLGAVYISSTIGWKIM